ncbi:MAG: hypothetical protein ABEJ60_04680 [Halodesulfurarchaeum sp.]
MSRLRLYSRSSGRCQYDSEREVADSPVNDRAAAGGRDGLLFYYDPSGEIWCHVDVVRDISERVLAQYETGNTRDVFAEFKRTLESTADANGWEIPDREGSKHEAYRSLPPTSPTDPPTDAVEDIRSFGRSGDALDVVAFGAPDYRSSMALVAYMRDVFDDDRSILLSTDRAVEGFDADIRIEYRPDLEEYEPIGDTAAWLNEQRFERVREEAASIAADLADIRTSNGLDVSRLTTSLRGGTLRETDATVIAGEELSARKRRAERWAFRRASVLFAIAGLAAVLYVQYDSLAGALREPIPIPSSPSILAGYSLPALVPSSIPTGGVLGGGIAALALGVGLLWWAFSPGRTSEGPQSEDAQPDGDGEAQGRVSLPEDFHTRSQQLIDTLDRLRRTEYIDDAGEYRDTVEDVLGTELADQSSEIRVLEPDEPAAQATRSRLRGVAVALGFAGILAAGAWLFVTLLVRYRQLTATAVGVLGVATLLLAGIGLIGSALRRRSESEPAETDTADTTSSAPVTSQQTAEPPADQSEETPPDVATRESSPTDTNGSDPQRAGDGYAFESEGPSLDETYDRGPSRRQGIALVAIVVVLLVLVVVGAVLWLHVGPSL